MINWDILFYIDFFSFFVFLFVFFWSQTCMDVYLTIKLLLLLVARNLYKYILLLFIFLVLRHIALLVASLSLIFLCGVDHCLSICPFSFDYAIVCLTSIHNFWLPLWYLQGCYRTCMPSSHALNTCVMTSFSLTLRVKV
jgi:hypothetical protein